MGKIIDVKEKECTKCKKFKWCVPNGLCIECNIQKFSKENEN